MENENNKKKNLDELVQEYEQDDELKRKISEARHAKQMTQLQEESKEGHDEFSDENVFDQYPDDIDIHEDEITSLEETKIVPTVSKEYREDSEEKTKVISYGNKPQDMQAKPIKEKEDANLNNYLKYMLIGLMVIIAIAVIGFVIWMAIGKGGQEKGVAQNSLVMDVEADKDSDLDNKGKSPAQIEDEQQLKVYQDQLQEIEAELDGLKTAVSASKNALETATNNVKNEQQLLENSNQKVTSAKEVYDQAQAALNADSNNAEKRQARDDAFKAFQVANQEAQDALNNLTIAQNAKQNAESDVKTKQNNLTAALEKQEELQQQIQELKKKIKSYDK